MNKNLKKKIENQLDQFQSLIEAISAHSIHSDDPDMWDSDYYYNLAEQLKEALQLLEGKSDRQGNEIEPGICSLLDDWETEQEDDE